MPNISRAAELRRQNAKTHADMTAILDGAEAEDRDLSADEQETWDRLNTEYEARSTRIARAEQADARDRDLDTRSNPPIDLDPHPANPAGGDLPPEELAAAETRAFDRWLRFGAGSLDSEQRNLLEGRERRLAEDESRFVNRQGVEMRAQSTTDAAGGYTIPEGFSNQLEEAMLSFSGMRRSRATIYRTASGNDVPWPTENDTGNSGALLAENTQDSEQDITFSIVTFGAYKYTSKIVRVSVELLQDSAFDFSAYLARKLATRIGRITNTHFTTGTGSGQPNGIVTAATLGKTGASGQTTSIIYDDLVDLQHSIDPDYREMSPEWMFRDATLKALKKIKDDQSRPIWQPGLAVREPDTILGDPYIVNQAVAAMAASAKSVLYGPMEKYVIRDVRDVTLVVLRERYADYHQVGYVAFSRHDGDLLDAGTNPIKYYANAAS